MFWKNKLYGMIFGNMINKAESILKHFNNHNFYFLYFRSCYLIGFSFMSAKAMVENIIHQMA